MKLIDKDALVAEMERIMNEQQEICKEDVAHGKKYPDPKNIEIIYQFQQFVKFINTLEVKDVDLTKEMSNFIDTYYKDAKIGYKLSIRRIAKHFFELGLKAKQG